MPFSAVSGTIAALSIAGAPPLACFISEFLIFVGAFQIIAIDPFYIIPTILMLVATVFSLAYALRFVSKVFLGTAKGEIVGDIHSGNEAVPVELKHKHKIVEIPNYMKVSLAILVVLVILIGIYPAFFMKLIKTVQFGSVGNGEYKMSTNNRHNIARLSLVIASLLTLPVSEQYEKVPIKLP